MFLPPATWQREKENKTRLIVLREEKINFSERFSSQIPPGKNCEIILGLQKKNGMVRKLNLGEQNYFNGFKRTLVALFSQNFS